ncbi:MAG: hypothetical protein GQ563_08935 [Desulfuromusa sp.]|nr:hypothetical protein [Desulfuromusa sp.]
MTTVHPNRPANLFVSTPTLPVNAPEESQVNLRPDQLVRATVIEGELGRAVLEINRQQYLAQGERELRVGQKLDLQVLQTQPRLEFKVLNSSLTDRLSQALPLLTRSFDWGQLVSQLQQQSRMASLPQATVKIHSQLQQILNPTAGAPVDLKGSIALIAAQLQQLSVSVGVTSTHDSLPSAQILPQPMLQNSQKSAPFELSRTLTPLLKNLQNQLSLLPKQTDQRVPKDWYVETRQLLAPFQQGRELPQLPAPQRQLLVAVLTQIQQHSRVSPQLAGEVERVLIQIERQFAQDFSKPAIKELAASTKDSVITFKQMPVHGLSQAGSTSGTKGGDVLLQLSADIKQLLVQVQQEQKQGIAPELLGRLEGLMGRLQQLPQVAGKTPMLLPGFEAIFSQLGQLVTQPPSSPQGGELGLLSQLFGFHLETELLQGKKKAALASLKLSLLNLQKEFGEEVKEPLRRIELFQLCKAKLGEEQVQFLPLPFNELEEGYLLAERQSQADEDNVEGEPPLQMSLSLRLSALGNVRIDMLYEKEGLHLRLAGENQGKMRYLQSCTDELQDSLQAIELQSVSFGADAQLPARQLQERLLPDTTNMLDARV